MRRTWAPIGQTPVLVHSARHHRRVSAIAAVTLSPVRRHPGWYFQLHQDRSICEEQVLAFLRHVRRHIRGRVLLIWDRLGPHRSVNVRAYLSRHRIGAEFLPAYAPELNAVEYAWSYLKKHRLGNYCPADVDRLYDGVAGACTPLRSDRRLLSGFVKATELPIKLKSRSKH